MSENQNGGLPSNVKALLCYLLGLLGGIIFICVEKEDQFVRFHAAQSIVASVSIVILHIVVSIIGIPAVGSLLNILSVVIMVVGMVKAYHNEIYRFPVIADLADSIFNKNK